MKTRNVTFVATGCAAAAAGAFGLEIRRRRIREEIRRLAALLNWAPGTTAADIGAGDGRYAIAAAERTDRVYATEVEESKTRRIEKAGRRRGLSNLIVTSSGEHSCNLPGNCCDSVLIRGAYHHFSDPAAFNDSVFRAVKPAGVVAVIDFRPRFLLGMFVPVHGVPANRGRHGIAPEIVGQELQAAGFQSTELIDPWFRGFYAVVVRKSA